MLQALRTNFRQVSNILQEGVDADGGYLVPEEYDHRLIDVLNEENIMRKLGHKITTSGEHKINIAATKPAAAWIEEGGALQFTDATFSQILLDAHKLHVAIKVTEELLYDNAFGLENYIIDQFGKALANAEEDAFLNGTGNGQPLAFSTDGGAEIGVTAASATEITADGIIDLVYALKRSYRKTPSILYHERLWQPSVSYPYKNNNGTFFGRIPYRQVSRTSSWATECLYFSVLPCNHECLPLPSVTTAIVPQYYVENSHEPIIPRDLLCRFKKRWFEEQIFAVARAVKSEFTAVSMLYRVLFTADIAVIFIDEYIGITEVTNLLFGDASADWRKKGLNALPLP